MKVKEAKFYQAISLYGTMEHQVNVLKNAKFKEVFMEWLGTHLHVVSYLNGVVRDEYMIMPSNIIHLQPMDSLVQKLEPTPIKVKSAKK